MSFSPAQVEERLNTIRGRLSEGWSQRKIGVELGVSESRVGQIIAKHGLDKRLYQRWIYTHDIRAMGKRAVEETA